MAREGERETEDGEREKRDERQTKTQTQKDREMQNEREKGTHAHKEEGSCSIVFCFEENIKDCNSVFLNSVFDVDAVRVMSVM